MSSWYGVALSLWAVSLALLPYVWANDTDRGDRVAVVCFGAWWAGNAAYVTGALS